MGMFHDRHARFWEQLLAGYFSICVGYSRASDQNARRRRPGFIYMLRTPQAADVSRKAFCHGDRSVMVIVSGYQVTGAVYNLYVLIVHHIYYILLRSWSTLYSSFSELSNRRVVALSAVVASTGRKALGVEDSWVRGRVVAENRQISEGGFAYVWLARTSGVD